MAERRIVLVLIRGRVQGVGFRAWTVRQAGLRRLAGFVRNRRDGAVEALFAGPAEAVGEMVAACRQGPSGSRVAEVTVEEAPEALLAEAGGGGFAVLPTR